LFLKSKNHWFILWPLFKNGAPNQVLSSKYVDAFFNNFTNFPASAPAFNEKAHFLVCFLVANLYGWSFRGELEEILLYRYISAAFSSINGGLGDPSVVTCFFIKLSLNQSN